MEKMQNSTALYVLFFTSLCKKLVKLTWVFRSIENDAHGIEELLLKTQVSLTSFLQSEVKIIHIIVQRPVPPGPSSIKNDAHGIEELLLKTQVSLTIFLKSEVKIIHIIVQNNTYYSTRSRWTKQQQILFFFYILPCRSIPY